MFQAAKSFFVCLFSNWVECSEVLQTVNCYYFLPCHSLKKWNQVLQESIWSDANIFNRQLILFHTFLIQYNRRYHKQFVVVFLLFCHSLDCNEAKVFETLFSWFNASNILERWVVGGKEGVRVWHSQNESGWWPISVTAK